MTGTGGHVRHLERLSVRVDFRSKTEREDPGRSIDEDFASPVIRHVLTATHRSGESTVDVTNLKAEIVRDRKKTTRKTNFGFRGDDTSSMFDFRLSDGGDRLFVHTAPVPANLLRLTSLRPSLDFTYEASPLARPC